MDIFERVATQIDSVGLPLFAVTLTALPRADTPALLMLHWHGFRREGPSRAGAPPPLSVAVPGSALQLNDRWPHLAELETAVLEAAWRLGAWKLERDERRACNTIGAGEREALECRQAFGDLPVWEGASPLIEDAPDRHSLMQAAARVGYVRWQFRPVSGGVWQSVEGDDTLEADGGRRPPCPVGPTPVTPGRSRHTEYRFGRIERLIVP